MDTQEMSDFSKRNWARQCADAQRDMYGISTTHADMIEKAVRFVLDLPGVAGFTVDPHGRAVRAVALNGHDILVISFE